MSSDEPARNVLGVVDCVLAFNPKAEKVVRKLDTIAKSPEQTPRTQIIAANASILARVVGLLQLIPDKRKRR